MAKGKVLKTTAQIEAEAAIAAEEAARTNRLVSARVVIDGVLEGIKNAQGAAETARSLADGADQEVIGKTEAAYIALAAVSHEHSLSSAECRNLIVASMKATYPDKIKEIDLGVGTFAKLRSELVNAMAPNVRFQIKAIMDPWAKAFAAEDGKDEQPMRDKFSSRHNAITQALRLAAGKPAKLNKKGEPVKDSAVAPFIAGKPATVLEWVAAHPRVKKSPQPASNEPVVSDSATPKDAAKQRVDQLIAAVTKVAAYYPHADCFADVLTALRACTVAKLCPVAPASPAPQPKPEKVLKVAEPVEGAADLDDAMGGNDEIAALKQQIELAELKLKLAQLSGK